MHDFNVEYEASSLSPTWSRHATLPPISDVATIVKNKVLVSYNLYIVGKLFTHYFKAKL